VLVLSICTVVVPCLRTASARALSTKLANCRAEFDSRTDLRAVEIPMNPAVLTIDTIATVINI